MKSSWKYGHQTFTALLLVIICMSTVFVRHFFMYKKKQTRVGRRRYSDSFNIFCNPPALCPHMRNVTFSYNYERNEEEIIKTLLQQPSSTTLFFLSLLFLRHWFLYKVSKLYFFLIIISLALISSQRGCCFCFCCCFHSIVG